MNPPNFRLEYILKQYRPFSGSPQTETQRYQLPRDNYAPLERTFIEPIVLGAILIGGMEILGGKECEEHCSCDVEECTCEGGCDPWNING